MAEPHRRMPGAPAALGLTRRFTRDARGVTSVEYAMIGGLIFAVVAGSLRLYGTRVDSVYERIGTAIMQVN